MHEETDTRMFLHAKHAADSGHRNISVKTVDSDVVAIAITMFEYVNVDQFWIEFGNGIHKRWIPIHEYVAKMGIMSKSVGLWFAFTGCDTVSSFAGRGKQSAWKCFTENENVISTFKRFVNY